MTIQQCEYVIEVAKSGSFTEAAQALFVAQTTVSLSIKALEEELDIKIFDRSNKGVIVTAEGAEFIKYASQLVTQAKFIAQRYVKKEENNRIIISSQHYDFVADAFGRFLKQTDNDSFSFSIKETRTYDVIDDVENARSDVGIIAIKDDNDKLMERFLSSKKLMFSKLIKTVPHVFIRKDHPLSSKKSIGFEDLKKYPFISYEQGEHNLSFFIEELSDTVEAKKHVEITDRATLMNLLLLTDSYTIGTGIMPSQLNGDTIISVPLQSEEVYLIGYIIKKNAVISEYTKRFINILSNCAEENNIICENRDRM